MRVYVPATVPVLAAAMNADPAGQLAGGAGFAVTPGLREWYASGDTEELEYAAMSLAAEASVLLIASDPSAPRRRVVVVAEVDLSAVVDAPDASRASRGMVTVTQPIGLDRVAAVHVDGAEAVAAVAAAAADPADDFAAGEAADHELLWYAGQELEALLQDVSEA